LEGKVRGKRKGRRGDFTRWMIFENAGGKGSAPGIDKRSY